MANASFSAQTSELTSSVGVCLWYPSFELCLHPWCKASLSRFHAEQKYFTHLINYFLNVFFPLHTFWSGNKPVFWQVWKSVVLNSVHLCRQFIWFPRLRDEPLHCCDKRSCQQHSDKHSHCDLNTFLCFFQTGTESKVTVTCSSESGSYFWYSVFMFLHTWRSFFSFRPVSLL